MNVTFSRVGATFPERAVDTLTSTGLGIPCLEGYKTVNSAQTSGVWNRTGTEQYILPSLNHLIVPKPDIKLYLIILLASVPVAMALGQLEQKSSIQQKD